MFLEYVNDLWCLFGIGKFYIGGCGYFCYIYFIFFLLIKSYGVWENEFI